ncbi:MAG: EutN/CcmL family microcompartment protein [Ignavibacteria bacterium]|jgi:microcompartment protein CcmK/EutM|nr:EutN/CcmL family microcompartment protein [Ignavibacteria bacterium]
MYLARVVGNIVSTQKNVYLKGHKLLVCKQIDLNGHFSDNKDVISLDTLDAGIGDTVIVAQEGDAVQQILGNKNTPVNTMIIAIVDNIEINKDDKT